MGKIVIFSRLTLAKPTSGMKFEVLTHLFAAAVFSYPVKQFTPLSMYPYHLVTA